MASGSNGDKSQRDRFGARGQPPRDTAPGGSNVPPSRPASGADDVDFGAFVSERVRSASERLKSGQPSGTPTTRTPIAGPSAPEPAEADEPTPIRRRRPSRYWRDSLKDQGGNEAEEESGESSQRFLGGASSRRYGEEGPHDDEEPGDGDDGNGGEWWRRYMSPDDDGGNQRLILLVLAALLVLALLVFGLTRILGNGDDGGEDPVPTPTESVIQQTGPDGEETQVSTPPVTTGETEEPEATETPEIRRGGDNQLSPPGGGDDDETPGASRDAYESEVARACTAECLVRLISPDATNILEETGNRPSFVGGDVAWAVVSPDEAEELHGEAEIALIADSHETYNLYVITSPDGAVDPAVSAKYGQVIDAIGVHALVAFSQVPAPISTLVSGGYEVHKLMPAPPESVASADDRQPLDVGRAGELMDQVDPGRIERTIADLMAIGELDNSGLGTRYYALPGNQIAADYLFQELESYGLEVSFEDFISWDGLLLVNVVAELPGRDDSQAYAVMSHFDSFNNTTTPRQAPGADDNATGMAVNLETARILADWELDHPVRFVFVNAEEVGIQGATAWAKRANATGDNIGGVLNVDSVGSARQGPYVVTNADNGSSWLQGAMSDVNERYGLGQVIQHLQDDVIVADDNMVRDEGIPAVMIARELYGWTPFHHTPEDTMTNVSIDSVTTMTYLTLLTTVHLATG
jgi:hypothetical protein